MEAPLADAAPTSLAEKVGDAYVNEGSTDCSTADDVSPKCKQSADVPSQWPFIWCHEHCYKAHRCELRRELEVATHAVGASLKCVKKAAQFSGSLLPPNPESYLLLTDWREVKHIHDFLLQDGPARRPMLTLVVCKSDKQQARVQRWAESLKGSSGPIHTLLEVESPKGLANDVLAVLAKCNDTLLALYLDRTFQPASPKNGARLEALPSPAPPAAVPPFDLVRMAAEAALLLPGPAMDVLLGIWNLCGTKANVERLLREAAPDRYED